MLLKLTAFILAITLFLTGCGYSTPSSKVEKDTTSDNEPEVYDGYTSVTASDGEITNPYDDVFTLPWLQSDSLNPFKSSAAENAAVSSLMYESLFTINPNFEAVPCLCTGYSVDDLTYTFNVKSGVTFHDGSALNAYDVTYSIDYAMESERFASRLGCIESVSTVDETTVQVVVDSKNYTLPVLLDIPIVRYGTADEPIPTGSGPYTYNRGSNHVEPFLKKYIGYRNEVPFSEIQLYDISDIEPDIAMSQRKVDFVLHDPLRGSLDVYTDHSALYYNTTVFQFLGFDTTDPLFRDSEIRRAISHLINRDVLVNDVFNNNVTAAPLALSPNAPGYVDMNESISKYSEQTFSSILNAKGAADTDGDGWLEVGGETLTLDFIVCDTDAYKVQAARKITSTLSSFGVKVDLQVLSYEDYLYAMENGYFNMYYAEVRLPANFDLYEIIGSSGSLNYGLYGAYNEALGNYLAAENSEQKNTAARELCRLIYEKSPIIPICYNKQAVAVPRFEIRGVKPSQQYMFWDLSNWIINFNQED